LISFVYLPEINVNMSNIICDDRLNEANGYVCNPQVNTHVAPINQQSIKGTCFPSIAHTIIPDKSELIKKTIR